MRRISIQQFAKEHRKPVSEVRRQWLKTGLSVWENGNPVIIWDEENPPTVQTIQEAARDLNMSEKTLRETWVRKGYLLPLYGKRQGRKLLFAENDVQAFAEKKDAAEILARFFHGCTIQWLNKDIEKFWPSRILVNSRGQHFFDHKLPPLSLVPPDLQRLSRHLVKPLSRKEIEYLYALLYRWRYPLSRTTALSLESTKEYRTLRRQARTTGRENWKAYVLFWNKVSSKTQSLPDKGRTRLITEAIDCLNSKNDKELVQFIRQWFPETEPQSIIAHIQWERSLVRRKPSCAAVGRVIGIGRMRASQVWQGVQESLRQAGIPEIGKILIRMQERPIEHIQEDENDIEREVFQKEESKRDHLPGFSEQEARQAGLSF